jgi:IgA Peptidase M64/Peptidase M64 N-terminus
MRRTVLLAAVFCVGSAWAQSQAPMTIRLDYHHRGGPGGERIEFDRVVAEGPWAGSVTQLVDTSGLGKYFVEVVDRQSGRVVYSRGFASLFGEWETTPEFKKGNQYFHESVRFPWPDAPVRVAIKKRNSKAVFEEIWNTDVDPRVLKPAVGRPTRGRLSPLFDHGPSHAKVDVLLISEGYSPEDLSKFRTDAARLVERLFEFEPFKTRRTDFNVRLLEIAGQALNVEYNIFGLERYALTQDNRALRDLAGSAPYDLVAILLNDGKYGGGGIFNQQSAVAAGNPAADYVFIHEFAHNLAGLGDEYVGNVTYETGAPQHVEPWEPNITALLDPPGLKWRDLVETGTPIPTPTSFAGKVGAFEGAGYEARGLYRPELECIMGSRKTIPFCRVCQRAINRIIDLHTR